MGFPKWLFKKAAGVYINETADLVEAKMEKQLNIAREQIKELLKKDKELLNKDIEHIHKDIANINQDMANITRLLTNHVTETHKEIKELMKGQADLAVKIVKGQAELAVKIAEGQAELYKRLDSKKTRFLITYTDLV